MLNNFWFYVKFAFSRDREKLKRETTLLATNRHNLYEDFVKLLLQRSYEVREGLPVLIALTALIHPVALLAALIYPLQVSRIAIARGPTFSNSWSYGFFMTISKFAEFQGIFRYYRRRLYRKSVELIEYK